MDEGGNEGCKGGVEHTGKIGSERSMSLLKQTLGNVGDDAMGD